MWNIPLDNKYVLITDSRQYILGAKYKSKNKKTGETEEKVSPEKFCSSLSGILKIYKEVKMKKADVSSFEEVSKEIQKLNDKIDKISKEIEI